MDALAGHIESWFDRLAWLLIAAALLLVLGEFAIVALRYGLDWSRPWLQELVLAANAIVFLLGAGYTLRHDGHVRVDIWSRQRSERTQALLELIGVGLFLLPFQLFLLWVSNVAALWVAAKLLDGFSYDTTRALLIGGAVLAVINWLIRPVVNVLAFPVIIVTLGLAHLVLGALMLWIMVQLTDGFSADGWAWLWAAIIVGLVNAVLQPMFGVERSGKRRR